MSEGEEEQIAGNIEELLKQNKRKITVEHVFRKEGEADPEGEKTAEEKLAEREAQLAALALAEFEKQKTELMDYVPEGKKERVEELLENDPKLIDVLKIQFMGDDGEEDDGSEAPPPKGKVKAYRKPKKESVEELYGILSSNQSTREERKVAESKLDKLWKKALEDRKTARKSLRGDE